MTEQNSIREPTPRGAVRLVFEYDGRQVRLVSRQRVDMQPPPTDPIEGYEGQQGFWVEVRDADGRTLHRRVMQDPIADAEVFSDEPGQSVMRVPVREPRGSFAILVPDSEDADHLALMSSPAVAGVRRGPATELARIPLTEDRPGGRP
jgi:hypothetical protein